MSSPPSSSAFALPHPVVLISIDGWGHTDNVKGNAIAAAKTPTMDKLSKGKLSALIDASGLAVGLPDGVMGNSEVGHLTMGAGRVSFQDLVRINASLDDGSFYTNARLVSALQQAKNGNGRLHLLGLVSDGAVHSHISHLFAFLEAAKKAQVKDTYIHFFADGRDTPPTSGVLYVKQLLDFLHSLNYGKLATIVGRYYAMDRDKRWDRIAVAYDLLFGGKGEEVNEQAVISFIENTRYANKQNDEFLKPILVNREGIIHPGDVLIFIDFRSDRMREINSLFALPDDPLPFDSDVHIDRHSLRVNIMTQYDEKWDLPIIFPPQTMVNGLTEWLSVHGVRQFHTAETEKYAHVTFFFSGGREEAFPLEDRELIPSPKVATYDLAPEMSQAAVADSVIRAIQSGNYPFIMCNFAAPDMVGHTGMYEAAVTACTACDIAVGRVLTACEQYGYTLLVTADHGNAEEMLDEHGQPKTSHTTNLIPILIHCVSSQESSFRFTAAVDQARTGGNAVSVGGLSDVAPTVLTLMGLPIPAEMSGKSLVTRHTTKVSKSQCI